MPRLDGRYARVGTVARVESSGDLPNGVRAVVLRGLHRAVVGVGVAGSAPGLWVEADAVLDPEPTERSLELAREYRAVVGAIADRMRGARIQDALAGVTDPGALADTAGWWPDLPLERKVELLETLDVEARLGLASWRGRATRSASSSSPRRSAPRCPTAWTSSNASSCCAASSTRSARSSASRDDDIVAEYRARLDGRDVPEAVREAVARELDRLERTGEQNPEQGWIRTWLDTVLDLPWGTRSDDQLDVVAARAVLDADHTGLDDVKDRVVEFLAVRKLRAERGFDDDTGGARPHRASGAILALVGPPGVGKTSLGESVARALGREFARVSLGGVRDEAELRGHRRTYVGCAARPHRPRAHRGGDDEPGRPARRGRQARRRLAR